MSATRNVMRRALRYGLWSLAGIVAVGALLFAVFVYSPAPAMPALTGTLSTETIEAGGVSRVYRLYVPRGLSVGAALVMVMHGSGENGAQMRVETGYEFDRLADEHHFVVVYPNALAHGGDWNACGPLGNESPAGARVDDVSFLGSLVDRLTTQFRLDASRVFAVGSSRGGFMALRLAIEAPRRFRAVAAVSANVHTPDNFTCKSGPEGTSSVLIMNGTEDPLVPFDGGNVSLLGFSYKYGRVMSSRASAQFLADRNSIVATPTAVMTPVADGVQIEDVLWRDRSNVEIELVAVHGNGHGIPQPYHRHPRLLGPSVREPNGPDVIWAFFERQRR